MAFRLEFSADAERDFGSIFGHLFSSYIDFGERPESAFDRARTRILEIRLAAERIGTAPYRGERHDDVLPGLRHLSIGRAACWLDVDGMERSVSWRYSSAGRAMFAV